MQCFKPGQDGYDDARRISNARFDYLKPSSICYASSEAGVQQIVRSAVPGKLRIRSGGHHHEGMSSGTDVQVLDVSKLSCINIRNNVLTVGPGARLGNIYDALAEERMLLPGGGCADVCVGGLVQGAGWGPYSRRLGLTCDQLLGFRMVKADGNIVDVKREDSRPPDLFWAVAGGGGGNFGVITELRFQLFGLGDTPITSFTVSWTDRSLYAAVLDDWASHFPFDGDQRLTSFCRLTKLAGGAALEPPIIVSGYFLGSQADCDAALARLLPNTYDKRDKQHKPERLDDKNLGRELFLHPQYQPGPPAEAVQTLEASDDFKSDLANTCAGYPFPHRVSSCYPNNNFGFSVNDIADYLSIPDPEPTARRYLSLHCFGGAIETDNPRSCFAHRKKPFLLQYQAWWAQNDPVVEDRCMKWVAGFRDLLKNYTTGSFINFPDRDILIDHYYGTSFGDLKKLKSTHDPKGLFEFPMGIPRG